MGFVGHAHVTEAMAFLKSARLLHQDFLGFSFQCTFLSERKFSGKAADVVIFGNKDL